MPELIRFYFDENVRKAVSDGLRLRGVNVLTVIEAGRRGLSDKEQLEFARQKNRVLFTQDHDFLILHAEGHVHAGIIYAKQSRRTTGEMIQGLLLIYQVMTPDELRNQVEYL